jgi:hypothetical protein
LYARRSERQKAAFDGMSLFRELRVDETVLSGGLCPQFRREAIAVRLTSNDPQKCGLWAVCEFARTPRQSRTGDFSYER